MTENLKNPLTAFLLSVFIPGLGQLYCDRARRGIIIFTTVELCTVIFLIIVELNLDSLDGLAGICFLIALLVWCWGIADAKFGADLYNQRSLLRTVETH